MGKIKVQWSKAMLEYITDEKSSYRTIARKYGVTPRAVELRSKKDNWIALRAETLAKVRQSIPAKAQESLEEVLTLHNNLAKQLIAKANEAVRDGVKPKYFKEVTDAIVQGVNIQRKVYGLDLPQTNVNNVVYIPPTWFKGPKARVVDATVTNGAETK